MKLFVISKNSNNPNLKSNYKKYCKVLSEVIKLAKKDHFDNLISNSKNKMETTCSIVKTDTRSKVNVNNIALMNVNDNLTNDRQIMLNEFNKYFLTVAESVKVEHLYDKNS
jgi:hypothetical protein